MNERTITPLNDGDNPMTKAEQLRALADRCEAASEGSRELDAEIAIVTFYGGWNDLDDARDVTRARKTLISHGARPGDFEIVGFSGVSLRSSPAYTASIDAAMTLVDAEWFWRIGHDGEGPDPSMFRADIGGSVSFGFVKATAATPALALCAASLRALAEKEEK